MKPHCLRAIALQLWTFVLSAVCGCVAQSMPSGSPVYLDPAQPIGVRVADLISRMTLEEKASQLVNQSRAIPRLQVPQYDWWSEALHGVANAGTATVFPEPIGLAATFDSPLIHEMAVVIGTEARAKHNQAVRAGRRDIMEGLDFWSPNINIFRDPRWGRGQETYGEDPFLTARMGVAFVTGLQGDDPKYYRVISTPKHFAVHSGPEPVRHSMNVEVSKHDMADTYLPAFRATVTEGKAGSVMCAYNRVNGEPACVSQFLLVDQLRNAWKFDGYVVSDCGAVSDILHGHHYTNTMAAAAGFSLKRGMDNECADFFATVKDNSDYVKFIDAVHSGLLAERDIDVALKRLFTARFRLGMFDPPSMVSYAQTPESEIDSQPHRQLALKLARESMVLLKNDGVLPLRKSGIKIAVVGPLADQSRVLYGNYNGTPSHAVSALEGMKAQFPEAQITFVPGTQFLRDDGDPVPASVLTTSDGKPGLKADFSTGELFGEKRTVLATRQVSRVDLKAEDTPQEAAGKYPLLVEWNGFLTPTETGEFSIGVRVTGNVGKLSIDGKPVAQEYTFGGEGEQAKTGHLYIEKGKKLSLKVEYVQTSRGPVRAQLIWSKYDPKPSPEAIAAAKKADVVMAVVGITSELEGEEMPISEEGFKGGDRTSIDLPKAEEDLLKALGATGKPLVVVLMNGSALAVNWAQQNANAILVAWYSGEEGGTAIAQTLAGDNNPAGRLPVTFYKGVDQLSAFEDYSMKNRTYRYFAGQPLYPFGYGLSYSKFEYTNLNLSAHDLKAGDSLAVDLDVKNTSQLGGEEVAQLYITFPPIPGAPLRALRGFSRIRVEPGATQHVRFLLSPRDLSFVNQDGDHVIAAGAYTITVGGGQPGTAAPSVSGQLSVSGEQKLPD